MESISKKQIRQVSFEFSFIFQYRIILENFCRSQDWFKSFVTVLKHFTKRFRLKLSGAELFLTRQKKSQFLTIKIRFWVSKSSNALYVSSCDPQFRYMTFNSIYNTLKSIMRKSANVAVRVSGRIGSHDDLAEDNDNDWQFHFFFDWSLTFSTKFRSELVSFRVLWISCVSFILTA